MIEAVKQVFYASLNGINVDDRNLLEVAYKNYICSRRTALRMLNFQKKVDIHK